jgi:hypothetical protein
MLKSIRSLFGPRKRAAAIADEDRPSQGHARRHRRASRPGCARLYGRSNPFGRDRESSARNKHESTSEPRTPHEPDVPSEPAVAREPALTYSQA